MGPSRVVSKRAAAHLAIGALASCLGCGNTPPNVLLITLDTTRADHLGVYGHQRDTSPNIDAFAAESTLYRNARSTSSWTLPSHASIFTGKLPSSHGARYDPDGPLELGSAIKEGKGLRARGVSPGEITLAERLSLAGYTTAGFAGGPWLLRTFGLAKGFDHWDDEGILDVQGRRAPELTRAVLEWLEAWQSEPERRPFFLFVNFFDPHFPYEPPTNLAREFLPARAEINTMNPDQFDELYDAEILYTDQHVGQLFDSLREREIYDETLVIVTADHGEMMGEQDRWGHNGLLLEPLVRVPLIVKPPGAAAPRVEERPVQLHSLFDLVLEAAGLPPDVGFEAERPMLAEVWHPPRPGAGEWKVLWDGALKYMHHGDGEHRLYDLVRDPRERVNLFEERPEEAQRMRDRLHEILAALPEPLPADAPQEIDSETREALERLGYLDPE